MIEKVNYQLALDWPIEVWNIQVWKKQCEIIDWINTHDNVYGKMLHIKSPESTAVLKGGSGSKDTFVCQITDPMKVTRIKSKEDRKGCEHKELHRAIRMGYPFICPYKSCRGKK